MIATAIVAGEEGKTGLVLENGSYEANLLNKRLLVLELLKLSSDDLTNLRFALEVRLQKDFLGDQPENVETSKIQEVQGSLDPVSRPADQLG